MEPVLTGELTLVLKSQDPAAPADGTLFWPIDFDNQLVMLPGASATLKANLRNDSDPSAPEPQKIVLSDVNFDTTDPNGPILVDTITLDAPITVLPGESKEFSFTIAYKADAPRSLAISGRILVVADSQLVG
jgi:hypothetical protein